MTVMRAGPEEAEHADVLGQAAVRLNILLTIKHTPKIVCSRRIEKKCDMVFEHILVLVDKFHEKKIETQSHFFLEA